MNDLIEKYKQQIEDAKNYSSEKKRVLFLNVCSLRKAISVIGKLHIIN